MTDADPHARVADPRGRGGYCATLRCRGRAACQYHQTRNVCTVPAASWPSPQTVTGSFPERCRVAALLLAFDVRAHLSSAQGMPACPAFQACAHSLQAVKHELAPCHVLLAMKSPSPAVLTLVYEWLSRARIEHKHRNVPLRPSGAYTGSAEATAAPLAAKLRLIHSRRQIFKLKSALP
jgi:hypothetical protein